MQPFLLAFVDSQAFKIFAGLMMLPFVLAAVAAVILLLWLTRAGLRRRRQQRAAMASPSGWQRLTMTLQLLPAALVGLVVLLLGINTLLDASQDRQHATACETALQRKTARLSLEVAGQYMLADSAWPLPNAALDALKQGWTLVDTTLKTNTKLSPSRVPYVELTLLENGTFRYLSNISGDATGPQVTGSWKLEPGYLDLRTVEGVQNLRDFSLAFSGIASRPGSEASLSGSLSAYPDRTAIYMVGAYRVPGNPNLLVFSLRRTTAAGPMKAP